MVLLASCNTLRNPQKIKTYAFVETSTGSFIIGLYEGTPEHKNNFIKNINERIYDSSLIYSVIPNGLMRMGLPSQQLESDYLESNFKKGSVKNEMNSKLINKTGAVGMLRLLEGSNPENCSDTKLFYLCEGIKTDHKTLKTLETKKNAPVIADYIAVLLKDSEYSMFKDSLDFYKINKMQNQWNNLYLRLTGIVIPKIEKDGEKLFKMSEYQLETYSKYGGAPIYDNKFVVFGEIVFGIDILQKLRDVKTGMNHKPKADIFIISVKELTKKEFKALNMTDK